MHVLDQNDLAIWFARIHAEYREMPGMRLTERQIQRLWGLDISTCTAVLKVLTTEHILVKTAQDTYILADNAASVP
jgi:hypothetical protein